MAARGVRHAGAGAASLDAMRDAHAEDLGPRPVHSTLAAAALLLALTSVGGCLAALAAALLVKPSLAGVILVLPALGLGAAACGGIALARIRRSRGRVLGRGAALVGLFFGLFSAVLQGAVGYGAMASFWPIKRDVVPAVARFVGVGSGFHASTSRATLSPAAAQAVDEARLAWFVGRLRRHAGAGVAVRFELQTLVDARAALTRTGAAGGKGDAPAEWPKPVSLRGDSGSTTLFVFLDDDALKNGRVLFRDALEIGPDGAAATLLPDGPAARVAAWLGLAPASP